MTIKEDYEMFSDIWKFYRKYREVKDDGDYWKQLICYRAHYNKLIFHFSGKIKEVLA